MTKSSPFARFQKANEEVRQRIIGLSAGDVGSRKTSFWLEAPGPIVIISLDKGLEGVVQRYQDDKEIYVAEYEWSPNPDDPTMTQDQAVELRDKITEDFESAIQNARTVIIDKENDLWELFRYAEFGAPNDAPRNYPALNQRYRRLINMPKSLDINFGCIDGLKDEWVSQVNRKTGSRGAVASGNRIRAGFGELDGLVHIVLNHTGVSPDTWGITVGKARGPGGFDIAGKELSNLSFPEFAWLVFPDSLKSDWE
jgi:hypothetical protein